MTGVADLLNGIDVFIGGVAGSLAGVADALSGGWRLIDGAIRPFEGVGDCSCRVAGASDDVVGCFTEVVEAWDGVGDSLGGVPVSAFCTQFGEPRGRQGVRKVGQVNFPAPVYSPQRHSGAEATKTSGGSLGESARTGGGALASRRLMRRRLAGARVSVAREVPNQLFGGGKRVAARDAATPAGEDASAPLRRIVVVFA